MYYLWKNEIQIDVQIFLGLFSTYSLIKTLKQYTDK